MSTFLLWTNKAQSHWELLQKLSETCFQWFSLEERKGRLGYLPIHLASLHLPWLCIAPGASTSLHLLLRNEGERLGCLWYKLSSSPQSFFRVLGRMCFHSIQLPWLWAPTPSVLRCSLLVEICFPSQLLYSSHICCTRKRIQQTFLKVQDNL